jgi:hypothetical protein
LDFLSRFVGRFTHRNREFVVEPENTKPFRAPGRTQKKELVQMKIDINETAANKITEPLEIEQALHEQRWAVVNAQAKRMAQTEGIPGAVRYLYDHQLATGVVKDNLTGLERFQLNSSAANGKYFLAQVNANRGLRSNGAGRTTPPPGIQPKFGGNYLVKDNISWQQYGLQVGLDVQLARRDFTFLMNPFPIFRKHATIAARESAPQSIISRDRSESQAQIRARVSELVELANSLPGYVCFMNGEGAGNTNSWLHFQAGERPVSLGVYPLEVAGAETQRKGKASTTLVEDYPLAAVMFRGSEASLGGTVAGFVGEWAGMHSDTQNLTMTLIAARRDRSSTTLDFYFVPRLKGVAKAPTLTGQIAAVEVLGELVLSADRDIEMLKRGDLNYGTAWQALASIEPPMEREILKSLLGQ